jgi:hypothetical protein
MQTGNEQDEDPRKRKPGRPKKAVNKSAVLVVRLTPAERQLIEQKAATAGIKTGEWFRKAAASAVIQSRLTVEEMTCLRSLSGLCNNLNQLTRLAHREGLVSIFVTVRAVLKDVQSLLDKIKSDDR